MSLPHSTSSRDPRSVADPLIGRASERAAIGELLAAARAGGSRALVLRGPAGVGKSALLDDAVRRAGPMLVLHGVGIESEAELPFAALHQMLHPHLDRLDALPAPQAAALRGAFGLTDDDVPSRFLVGAATLTLLAALAESVPVLCVVDDVQWLDQGSADALLFAARRFQADPVAVLFAVRESSAPFPAPGLPSLRLEGLGTEEAQTLLDARSPGLPGPVRVEVLREAAGNPLALIELAAASRAAERDGRVDLAPQVGPLPVARRVRDAFRAQIGSLPESTRTALVAAAADTVADLGEVLSVLAVLGLPDDALTPAEELDLVAVDGGRISFRHPLVRAAAYQGTPHALRIAVHRAYATVLAADADADRRTWHRAASSTGPDEAVAAELELAAERARRRGGAMAVSAAYERSARLSVDLPARARRTLRAARAAYDAGRADRAARLATDAADLATDHVLLAEATHVRAMVEYERTSPAADARLALEAARLMGDGAGEGADQALLLLTEVIGAGRDGADLDLVDQGVALLRDLRLPPDPRLQLPAAAQLGWADLFAGRPERAAGLMYALIDAARAGPVDPLHRIVAGLSGVMLADDDATVAVMETMLGEARATGAMLWVPYSLEVLGLGRMLRGDLADLAARLPTAAYGYVEVRQVVEFG